MKRAPWILGTVLVLVPVAYVTVQAIRTLEVLVIVERERDTWQRPDDVLRQLELEPGDRVVDLGSGAGYFALKIAPRVAPGGRVFAIDLRRQSLAFLWIRALQGRQWNLETIHSEVDNPHLPGGGNDAVLIANTYHELTAPAPILAALSASMRPGAVLVVLDRGPRGSDAPADAQTAHHDVTPTVAEREIRRHGFITVTRDDRFIDRAGDEDLWWLLVFRKP